MADKCVEHPGRDAVATISGKKYCVKCQAGILAAVASVDGHVEPKRCFVTYQGGDRWTAITGTGCAHWVAHQKNINDNSQEHCLEGCKVRVPDLVRTRVRLTSDLNQVQAGDIWTNSAQTHCGIVIGVKKNATVQNPTAKPTITIQHDSSGQGKVATNDFAFFGSQGGFYR